MRTGVEPDVPSNSLSVFWSPQQMIVVARLPEASADSLLIEVAGALFEVGDEPRQLAGLTGGFGENVNVIGHHAVGVQNEAEAGGTAGEQLDRP